MENCNFINPKVLQGGKFSQACVSQSFGQEEHWFIHIGGHRVCNRTRNNQCMLAYSKQISAMIVLSHLWPRICMRLGILFIHVHPPYLQFNRHDGRFIQTMKNRMGNILEYCKLHILPFCNTMNTPEVLWHSRIFTDDFALQKRNLALVCGRNIFKKTRYHSHMNFIHTCLKEKLIPVGFRISRNDNSLAQRFQPGLRKAKDALSRRIMRNTSQQTQNRWID